MLIFVKVSNIPRVSLPKCEGRPQCKEDRLLVQVLPRCLCNHRRKLGKLLRELVLRRNVLDPRNVRLYIFFPT